MKERKGMSKNEEEGEVLNKEKRVKKEGGPENQKKK